MKKLLFILVIFLASCEKPNEPNYNDIIGTYSFMDNQEFSIFFDGELRFVFHFEMKYLPWDHFSSPFIAEKYIWAVADYPSYDFYFKIEKSFGEKAEIVLFYDNFEYQGEVKKIE